MCKFNNQKNIYWVRHAEAQSNISEINYKIIDPGLTSLGYIQCEILKKYLESNKIIGYIDLVVVSPLERTLETCNRIIDHNNSIPIISLDEIRERIDHPCHKRDLISKKKSQYKFINYNQIKNDYDFLYDKFNGNEPESNVKLRCKWFIDWLKNRKEKNILVITHGNFLFPMFADILSNVGNINFFSNCEIRKSNINFIDYKKEL
jgi:broad specificity phosphatase PhoE